MERTWNDGFGFEIIAKGQFVDQGCSVKTIVIRLNGSAMNEWHKSANLNLSDIMYEPIEEFEERQARRERLREDWEREILQKLNFAKNDNTSACITQNVAEIFTVVLMEQVEGGEKDEKVNANLQRAR